MSIQTTNHVSRNWAIDRIKKVAELALHKQYRDLEAITSEYEYNLEMKNKIIWYSRCRYKTI